MWPNLFLVGAAKSGTTSVYEELARHPRVYMSPVKEPHFFSRIQPSPERRAFFPHVSDQAEYLALFGAASGEELVGEASTSYLWDEHAAERIRRVAPGARILIMLRDPVERAYSQYWNDVREGIESRPFADAVAAEERSGPGAWGVTSLYIDCGRYADQVARYLDRFGDRVLVSFLEDLVRDRAATMARIRSFLGLGPEAPADRARRMNPASAPRNALSRAILASGRARTIARATVPRALRARLRGALVREIDPPPMDPATRRRLEEIFRPEVARLSELLGEEPPWGRWTQAARPPARSPSG
jgi:hypothetical protein